MSDGLRECEYRCRTCGSHVVAAVPAGTTPIPLCIMCRMSADERAEVIEAARRLAEEER